jgi:hypothetical protein
MPSLRLLRTWGSASFDALAVLPASPSVRLLSLSFGYQQHLSDMLDAITGLLTAGIVLSKIEIKVGQIHRGGTDDFLKAAGALKAAVDRRESFQGLRIQIVVVVYQKNLELDVKQVGPWLLVVVLCGGVLYGESCWSCAAQVLAHPKIYVKHVSTYRNRPGGYNVFDNPYTPRVVVIHEM